jgi:ubiquinone/menaquinone biosynthesis C-methylase UbiE
MVAPDADRRQYYQEIFDAGLDAEWDQAPGKDVIIAALAHEHAESRLRSSESAIDLGCGTGYLLDQIASRVCSAWTFVGVDFSLSAIERGTRLYPKLRLFCGDATVTPFPPAMFSVALSYGSIEHMDNPADALAEAARILQPGGLFLMMIPTLGVYRTDRDDEGWYGDLTDQPQWNLCRDTWESYFRRSGLDLWETDVVARFGAVKPGVFYFGRKGFRT